MNRRVLESILHTVEYALKREDRILTLTRAATSLEDDIERLDNDLLRTRTLFHQTLETWWKETVKEELDPFVIGEDRRISKLYVAGAISSIALEMGLAGWISNKIGFPIWAGVGVALLLPVILEAVFNFIFWNRDRPRETLDKLKRRLLMPSSGLFGTAFLFLLAYRVLPVDWAVTLEPLVTLGLWMTTIGALLMAGSLLAAARIYNWSARDADEHKQLTHERQEANRYKEEFRAELTMLHPTENTQPRTLVAQSTTSPDGTIAKGAAVLMVIALVLPFTVSCSQKASGLDSSAGPRKLLAQPPEMEMEVYIDSSKSPQDDALLEAARNINNSIRSIIEKRNVVKLRIFEFGRDGFVPSEKKVFVIEPMEIAELPSLSERENFRNDVKDEKERELINKLTRLQGDLKKKYMQNMDESLKGLSSEMFLPSSSVEPRCTDLNGVFRRISMTSDPRPHLMLIVTDGVHNCGQLAEGIAPPQSDVLLVIVLCPEKIEAKSRSPLATTSSSSYDTQSTLLSKAVSWGTIVPQFTEDFDNTFDHAKTLRSNVVKQQ